MPSLKSQLSKYEGSSFYKGEMPLKVNPLLNDTRILIVKVTKGFDGILS